MFWLWPTDTGGSSSLSFDLRYIRSDASSKADANWTLKRQANVTSQVGRVWHMLTELTGGTPHDVQVRAVNSAGEGPWSATVTGTPTKATPCATGGAVANAANNPGLVSDCDTLLELRDTLAGARMLNWSGNTSIANWDGINVGGTPQRVILVYFHRHGLTGILPPELGNLTGLTQLTLLGNKLTGTIPSELANLSQLTQLDLGENQLSGPIPSELGRMPKLQGLALHGNRLTGSIPPELGSLNNLQALHIDSNQLTGTIPPELGRLSSLRWLTLRDNRLTGEIPAELGRLTNLQQLSLSGNRFSGCVPTELRGVSDTDLKYIVIPYCDVLLSGLRITSGTLSPQFDAYVTDYRAAARASRITVSPSSRHNATFEYLDRDDNVLADADGAQAGYQVDAPATMATTIKIKVTSSDGKANHTYTIQLTGPGALGAPEVHQVTAGTNSLTVSWAAPSSDGGSAIIAYDLRHIRSDASSKADANWTVVQDVWTGSGTRSYELAGLDGGTQYDVQVRAVNVAGDGPWSSTATGTPTSAETTPGSPANAQYVRVGSTTVVSWDPSTGATHYKLYHSDSRFPRCSLFSSGTLSGCDELAANISATTYTHANPDADTNSYWITACNAAGCSEIDSGNPARFVDNRPAAPTGAQYVRVGTTTVVTWDPSAGATHYKVYYDDFFDTSCRLSSGRPSFCELLAGNVTGTTYTHASPDEDRNYYWVVGCNNAGCSDIDSGNPATLVESTRSATAPGAPTRLTATANGQTRIDLSWTAPSDDGGAGITGYKIEVSTNGSTWSDLVANTGSAATSYSHTGLTAGSTRHYRVSAINSAGAGPASGTDSTTTESQSNAAPTTVGTIPDQILTLGTELTVDVSPYFSDPDDDALSYTIWSPQLFNRESVSGGTVTLLLSTGAIFCDPKTVTITAQDPGGLEATQDFTLRRVNNQPVASTGTFPSQTIEVGETARLYMGNWFSDTDYCDQRLMYSAESSDTGNATASASGNIVSVEGKSAGTATITVTAEDGGGLTATLDIQVTVTAAAATKPGKPTGLTATADGQTRIDLSWTAPSDDGGATITGYKIEVSTNGSSWSDLVANTHSTSTSYSHTGLTAGSTRHYRVSAINSAGTGPASNTSPTPPLSAGDSRQSRTWLWIMLRWTCESHAWLRDCVASH